MNVRNCRKCGKVFNYFAGPPICQVCRTEAEEKFQTVKKYVYEHHGAPINEVSETCEVEAAQIQQWIREERLAFAEDSPISIACEKCGIMIKTGRFCQKCKNDMTNTLRNVYSPKPAAPVQRKDPRDPAKMRFL